ncbi:phytanoyl-CoA dioxygenase family protein [Hymenobacter sp. BT491]|uniref:phytanoyl-CoA dioxygenase family protein n=1 Tax=Hymenobacter sp. BT491 TaxID=2766779 RepID=UPI001653C0C8|nr:phytanoyl-CoA dioxygenase family protein [Hymenobacter sp. BT491]
MEDIVTVRIHLDDCDASNGALRVVPSSHNCGVIRSESLPTLTPEAVLCPVKCGGVMLMKPLLLHTSNRSTAPLNRRVIHLEFSSLTLPSALRWREQFDFSAPAKHSASY